MKNASAVIICCILSLFVIPLLFLTEKGMPDKKIAKEIKVLNCETNKIVTMDIEEYIWRVVAAEMPYTYEEQALKAQCVAARTYALKKQNSNITEHKGADVCTDFNHCMAFMTDERALEKWGENCEENKKKFIRCANDTVGEVLEYKGELITCPFYAISSGVTENSWEVWNGPKLEYLTSVESEVDKNVNGYKTEAVIDIFELEKTLGLEKDDKLNFTVEKMSTGTAKHVIINGKTFTGQQIRSKLGLRSAHFEIKQDANNVKFIVYGYGHGVGMSQTGANELAKQNMNYKSILLKYYKGTQLVKRY